MVSYVCPFLENRPGFDYVAFVDLKLYELGWPQTPRDSPDSGFQMLGIKGVHYAFQLKTVLR